MAKKKKTDLEKAFKHEQRRIHNFVTNASKRGFQFDYPDVFLPEGKKPTKRDVMRLKGWTPERLYKRALYLDEQTGEILSGQEGRKLERRRAAEKGIAKKAGTWVEPTNQEYLPSQADLVLEQVQQDIRHFTPLEKWSPSRKAVANIHNDALMEMLWNQIDEEGRDAVAARLEEHAVEINQAMYVVQMYKDNQVVNAALHDFQRIIKGTPLSLDENKEITAYGEMQGYGEEEI